MKKAFIIVICLICIQCLNAQQVNNVFAFQTSKKSSVMLNMEFDPALFWGITYNRSFDIKIGEFERRISGQFGWKTYRFNYNDLNLNIFTTLRPQESRFNVIANVGVENKYLENTVHQANVYNWVAGIMPGYFTDKWYVGTEIMYKQLFGAKYEHTDFYRAVYPDVRDGWYRYKNAYLNLSVNMGVKLSNHFDLDLRAGYRLSHDFKNYQPYVIPYFGNMALNFRF